MTKVFFVLFLFFATLTRLLQVLVEFWLHSNQNSTPMAMMGNVQYLVTWHCHIYIISGLVNIFSDLKHTFDQPVCNFGSFGLCWAQETFAVQINLKSLALVLTFPQMQYFVHYQTFYIS